MIEKSVTTINLDGNEQTIEFTEKRPYYWIDNRADGLVYVSFQPDITAGADGVYSILAGTQFRLDGGSAKKFYIKGGGEVQIIASEIASNPFNKRGKGGGVPMFLTAKGLYAKISGSLPLLCTIYEEA